MDKLQHLTTEPASAVMTHCATTRNLLERVYDSKKAVEDCRGEVYALCTTGENSVDEKTGEEIKEKLKKMLEYKVGNQDYLKGYDANESTIKTVGRVQNLLETLAKEYKHIKGKYMKLLEVHADCAKGADSKREGENQKKTGKVEVSRVRDAYQLEMKKNDFNTTSPSEILQKKLERLEQKFEAWETKQSCIYRDSYV